MVSQGVSAVVGAFVDQEIEKLGNAQGKEYQPGIVKAQDPGGVHRGGESDQGSMGDSVPECGGRVCVHVHDTLTMG